MRNLFAALAILIAGPVSAAEIMVMDAYARVGRPGAPTGAVFMMIHNMGAEDDRLIGASSSVARAAQIHATEVKDDIVRMRHLEDGVPLPAGKMHEFGRGGDHVMLMGLTEKLSDGDAVPVTLIFEKAGEVTVEVKVDNQRGQPGSDHKHSDH
ncbi:copper chaperone PCu(A)C [Rhodobacteraceae bacterium]|nr:copper chaperone PCu(A)C [Paracoccaceae bacterium]